MSLREGISWRIEVEMGVGVMGSGRKFVGSVLWP